MGVEAEGLYVGIIDCRLEHSKIGLAYHIQSLRSAMLSSYCEHTSCNGAERLTHCICSASFDSDIFSLILSELTNVHRESWQRTLSFVKISKSANLLGVSSIPNGLRSGAFATY